MYKQEEALHILKHYFGYDSFREGQEFLIELNKEEQMKLGYQKETIRLYYPADSLLRLLGKELSIE